VPTAAGDTRTARARQLVRTPHKEQTNPTRPSRRPQTAPGDLPATNLADKEPAETADLDRKLENVCSPSHHIQLLVSVKYFARIYLRQALRLSHFPPMCGNVTAGMTE
jgi:hypothetical protein